MSTRTTTKVTAEEVRLARRAAVQGFKLAAARMSLDAVSLSARVRQWEELLRCGASDPETVRWLLSPKALAEFPEAVVSCPVSQEGE